MSLRAFLIALDSQSNGIADANAAAQMLDTADARKWLRQNSNV
jgi:hypothetical protein